VKVIRRAFWRSFWQSFRKSFFHEFWDREGKITKIGYVIASTYVVAKAVIWIITPTQIVVLTPAQKAEKLYASCREAWSSAGEPRGLKSAVASHLRDPDSFQVQDASYTRALEKDGSVRFEVTYRARNGFGGMNVGGLSGYVNPDCSISGISFGAE